MLLSPYTITITHDENNIELQPEVTITHNEEPEEVKAITQEDQREEKTGDTEKWGEADEVEEHSHSEEEAAEYQEEVGEKAEVKIGSDFSGDQDKG